MRLLNKIKRLLQDHLVAIAVLCAAAAAFVPSSQVAAVFVGLNSVSASPQSVPVNGYSTLSWLANNADNCYVSGPGANNYYNASSLNSWSVSVGPIPSTSQYSVQCFNYGPNDSGSSVVRTVTVSVTSPTTITSFTASPNPVVSGSPTTLSWTGSAGGGFNNCNLYGGEFGGGSWTYPLPGSRSTSALTTNTTYGLQCTDQAYGTIGPVYANVTVSAPAVSADMTSNSPRLVGQTATLSFYADSTVAPTQCQINNYNDTAVLLNVAGCSTAQARTYTTPAYSASGSYSYKFYYYLNGAWTLAKIVTVTVNSSAPVPSISASPTTVALGATSTLTWSASNLSAGKQCTLTAPSSGSLATNFGSITSGTFGASWTAGFFIANGYVYQLGGWNGSSYANQIVRAVVGSDLTSSGSWSVVGTLPANAGTQEIQPVVVNGVVYLFGGNKASDGSTVSTICQAPLSNLTGGWTCPASLPAGAAQHHSEPIVVGPYIYRIGGRNGTNSSVHNGVLRAPVSSPTSWTWFSGAGYGLPANLESMPVVVAGTHVYVLGGWTGSVYNNTVYRALASSDLTLASSWSVAGALPVTQPYQAAVAVDSTYLYYIGGAGSANIYRIAISTLAAGGVTAGSWSLVATLPTALQNTTPLVVGDHLYLMGGYNGSSFTDKVRKIPFNTGLAYTSGAMVPWRTDGSSGIAITWPITGITTYTMQCTNVVGTNTASVTVGPTDYCTNAPFNGYQSTMPANATAVGTTCSCNSGYVWSGSACTVGTTPPTMSITPADPNSGLLVRRVRRGGSIYLNWNVSGLAAGDAATSCNVSSSPAGVIPTQTWNRATSVWTQANNPLPAIVINNPATFTVSCTNAAWSPSTVSASAYVGLVPAFQEQ